MGGFLGKIMPLYRPSDGMKFVDRSSVAKEFFRDLCLRELGGLDKAIC